MRPELAAAIKAFAAAEPMIDVWRRYPDVSVEEDNATDAWACATASLKFAEFLRARGFAAQLVYAEFTHPMAGGHAWVEVEGLNIDWTARQYHNLEHPPAHAHADLPCPLIWRGDEHPTVGEWEPA